MDTSDPEITFNEQGVSNHYYEYGEKASRLLPRPETRTLLYQNVINEIKGSGKGTTYDCLIGLSGGVDSSYITYLAGEMGLKALIVHFDNGWNSELAVSNIEKLVNKYNFDLHTLVVDWKEFKDIQLSFFKASVPNIEVVTDHAIIATLYRIAEKYKIKYLLSGSNIVTEGILPSSWGYDASDFYHIKSIHKRFGTQRFKTFPSLSLLNYFYYMVIRKVRKVNLLNYVDYNKDLAIQELQQKVGWQYYGGKHYESVFTQFFQAYVLPKKFGFDKRRAHLSTLICSGQKTREEALEEMNRPLYDDRLLAEHIDYILKKWELTRDEFEKIMKLPPQKHEDYPTNQKWMEMALKLKNKLNL
jgi:N-acetyl sugar amidotransferase